MTTWDTQLEYATNLLPYSEDFSQWSKISGTIIQPGYTDPFELTGATKITDSSATQFGQVYYTLNLDGTITRTFSAFIMKDTDVSRVPSIRMTYASSKAMVIRLDSSTGDIAQVTGEGITLVDYGVDDYDSAWRIWVASKKDTLVSVGFSPSTALTLVGAAATSVTGSAIYFGAQLEVGSEPTGYIKTEGASLTVKKRTEWAIQNAS